MINLLRQSFVSLVYADHNRSGHVKKALKKLFEQHGSSQFILNIGSGDKRILPHIKNLDIKDGPNVDYVGSAEKIPLEDSSVDLIITQEAFEHISNPEIALLECNRILKQGGVIYYQVPFIIGYHPGPTDFIRFTKEGVSDYLTKAGFEVNEIEISVAGATGFYRIAVEFFAILLSGPISFLYIPAKTLTAFLLYPLKILDPWFRFSRQRDRIPGGYYAIAIKPYQDEDE